MRLNTVILADDSYSSDVSDLFVLLKDSTTSLLEEYCSQNSCVELKNQIFLSDSIDRRTLSSKLSSVNFQPFICYWYGHGTGTSFSIDNEEIVSLTENHYAFSNALIYTFSCHNAKVLADTLIENKLETFVGYTSEAKCPYGLDDLTTEIIMTFISSFLEGKTASEAVEELKSAYESTIFNEELDPFQRGWFQENRDALVIKGNKNLAINDVLIN